MRQPSHFDDLWNELRGNELFKQESDCASWNEKITEKRINSELEYLCNFIDQHLVNLFTFILSPSFKIHTIDSQLRKTNEREREREICRKDAERYKKRTR